MNFSKKVVGVLGLGRSGLSAARLLASLGAKVVGFDDNPKAHIPQEFQSSFSNAFLGRQKSAQMEKTLKKLSLLVVSPGIPFDHYIITKAIDNNVEVISEVELGYIYANTKNPTIIAVTGTNGKSTTTTLIHEFLSNSGYNSYIGGNIGVPFTEVLYNYDISDKDFIVLELSSFQLRYTRRFRPKVAVILNITEDHLDRHIDLNDYYLSKAKLLINQTLKDYVVLNAGDNLSRSMHLLSKAKLIVFSKNYSDFDNLGMVTSTITGKVYLDNFTVVWEYRERGGTKGSIEIPKLPIGLFHLENIVASLAATLPFGIQPSVYVKVLKSFEPLEGRLHYVNKIGNVWFYDDSKATNPSAMLASLESLIGFDGNIILIAGGKNKNLSFESAACKASKKIRAAILYGESAPYLANQFRKHLEYIFVVPTLDKAVDKALEIAKMSPDTKFACLLAPGCASHDQFPNAEARARFFDDYVNRLAKKEKVPG